MPAVRPGALVVLADMTRKKTKEKGAPSGASKLLPGVDTPPTQEMLESGIESMYWERFDELMKGDGDALLWALDIALRNIVLGAAAHKSFAGMDPYIRQQMKQDFDTNDRSYMEFPIWLAAAIRGLLMRYLTYQTRTLDEAFAVSRKGVKLDAKRRDLEVGDLVVGDIFLLAEANVPIGVDLFEAVGKARGLDRQRVSELWAQSDGRRMRAVIKKFGPIHELMTVDRLPSHLREIAVELLGPKVRKVPKKT